MNERSVPQPTESGWYAGPWPDEVYYLTEDGQWLTSFTRPEDTSHIEKRLLFTEDPRIARIEALCDEVDQANADPVKTHWLIFGTDELRAILRGEA